MSGSSGRAAPPHVVVLAGGAGTRMKTGAPKLLHPLFFRPTIRFALDAAEAVAHRSVSLVVGRDERAFREACRDCPDILVVRQESPLGTADALRALEPALIGQDGDVLVLYGDCVLLTPGSLRAMMEAHAESGAACTVGRPARAGGDAGVFCFRLAGLFEALRALAPSGPRREFRLEDAAAGLAASGLAAAEYRFADPLETLDVDDFRGLELAESVLRLRHNEELMRRGAALQDARTTLIDPRCRIGRDVRIEGGCTVINSTLEDGVVLENFCRIIDCEIGAGSLLRQGTCAEKSRVGRACRVGPYARLREGTRLDEDVWIGNFVELKEAVVGSGTRAGHLSFIGDAEIGRNVNIGCGFVTCNSSGRPLKQRTIIEDDVFIGSDSQAIAPVKLGAGSFVATGTSVTEDVPPDSFVISRGRQVTKPGYAKKYGKAKAPAAPR